MTATYRHAARNTTPIASVLGHEERITRLERENAELRQIVSELNNRTYRMQNMLRINTTIDISHNERLRRLETVKHGDLRLSEVLGGIEARLAAVELGGEDRP
jgi:predicted RNase H-like nuclease (RuvC/YqgF family)